VLIRVGDAAEQIREPRQIARPLWRQLIERLENGAERRVIAGLLAVESEPGTQGPVDHDGFVS
jgi:hypothetical protein